MQLSIVVVFHNMRREAQRTLFSLSTQYQRGLHDSAYEVIAVDSGSSEPLSPEMVKSFGPNFHYLYCKTDAPSPVAAANAGANMARGENLAVIVDGARMTTPGLLDASLKGLRLFPEPFVYVMSWHLGPAIQSASMLNGYDQAREDRMLEEIDWQENGYRLFEVSTLAPSSRRGFLSGIPSECSWFAMRRASFLSMGGFEQRFRTPGGGLTNQDFRDRAMELPGIQPVGLLGEGVFHQFHGGVATNVPKKDLPIPLFQKEYAEIRGTPWNYSAGPEAFYIGTLCTGAMRFIGPDKNQI